MKNRILASNMLATQVLHGTKVETFRGVTLTNIAAKTANLVAIETHHVSGRKTKDYNNQSITIINPHQYHHHHLADEHL